MLFERSVVAFLETFISRYLLVFILVQTPPSPMRGSNEDGGNRSGEVKITSPSRAVAASGAYFNKAEMRWEVRTVSERLIDLFNLVVR